MPNLALKCLLFLLILLTSSFSETRSINNSLIFSTVAINIENRALNDAHSENYDNIELSDQYNALRFMGTGIVISEPEKNVYYILTNKHVVTMESIDGGTVDIDLDENVIFVVPHFLTYGVDGGDFGRWEVDNILTFDTLDLAIIKLDLNGTTHWSTGEEIPATYFPKLIPIKIEQYIEIELLDTIYSAGYPSVAGNLKLMKDIFITKSEINSIIFDEEGWKQLDYYSLVYRLGVKGGMSGGPVVNSKGNLIGINGLTEQAYRVEEAAFSLLARSLAGFFSWDWITGLFKSNYNYIPEATKYDYGIHVDDFVFRALMDDEFNNNPDSDFYNYLPNLDKKYLERLKNDWVSGYYYYPSIEGYFDSSNIEHRESLKKFINKE